MKIKAFLPCRSGSQRVKNKNIRKFAHYSFGLFQLKIEQLIKVNLLNEIIVSTDDIKIINFLKKKKYKKVKYIIRPKKLALSSTRTDDLIAYAAKLFDKTDHILWTHVTSPLFSTKDYTYAIKIYIKRKKTFDTLIGCNEIQEYIFNKNKPINYNYSKVFWPNTQNLKKLHSINNTLFLTSAYNYKIKKNRIGSKLFFLNISKIKSIDVDNLDDFKTAEKLYSINVKKK
tara:strand:- start:274 stop:960 length:687 start_codon:yes stop_codon:yes gene_type:complete